MTKDPCLRDQLGCSSKQATRGRSVFRFESSCTFPFILRWMAAIIRARQAQFVLSLTALVARACGRRRRRRRSIVLYRHSPFAIRGPKPRGRSGMEGGQAGVP